MTNQQAGVWDARDRDFRTIDGPVPMETDCQAPTSWPGPAGSSKSRSLASDFFAPADLFYSLLMNPRSETWEWPLLVLLAATSPLLFGYHFGADDQVIWLPAIKKCLHPELYGLDASFFLAQTRFSLFPQLIAFSTRSSHLSLEVNVLLWHVFSLMVILVASRQLAALLFHSMAARWAAIAAVWVSRLTPVAGTHLSLTDIYLHPRDLAFGAILCALVAGLKRRPAAFAWIAAAAVIHPTMAIFGGIQIFALVAEPPKRWRMLIWFSVAILLLAGLMLFLPEAPANTAWHNAFSARSYVFPLRWPTYVWLYTAAALAGTRFLAFVAQRRGLPLAARIGGRASAAGGLGLAAAVLFSVVQRFVLLVPIETARMLHFTFFLAILLAGGLLGETLRVDRRRWIAFLLPITAAFALSSRLAYPRSPYVEWPGRPVHNDWLQAFEWIKTETPSSALFAVNPGYLALPDEDRHGFRAFAERSVMADSAKDRSVSSLAPQLSSEWQAEEQALHRWTLFTPQDFADLQRNDRVGWVLLETSHPSANAIRGQFSCPYSNTRVMVCKLP